MWFTPVITADFRHVVRNNWWYSLFIDDISCPCPDIGCSPSWWHFLSFCFWSISYSCCCRLLRYVYSTHFAGEIKANQNQSVHAGTHLLCMWQPIWQMASDSTDTFQHAHPAKKCCQATNTLALFWAATVVCNKSESHDHSGQITFRNPALTHCTWAMLRNPKGYLVRTTHILVRALE